MKRKHLTKKLVFSKETVVKLTDTESKEIAGGIQIVGNPVTVVNPIPPQSTHSYCPTYYANTCWAWPTCRSCGVICP